MDAHEWEISSDYIALWSSMEWGEHMDRKRRLIATGVCRRLQPLIHDPIFHRVIELSEQRSDEAFSSEEWDRWDETCEGARLVADGVAALVERAAGDVVYGLRHDDHKIGRALETAADVFGYRAAIAGGLLRSDANFDEARAVWTNPVFLAGRDGDGSRFIAEVIRDVAMNPFRPVTFDSSWRTEAVVALARGMYESRDFAVMPVLADALDDAGCDHPDVLAHCRGAGPHVRGCWVVDLVLGKA